MPHTLSGDDIQLWIGQAGSTPDYQPLGGEERCRMEIRRATNATISQSVESIGWVPALANAGRAQLRVEVHGRSNHSIAQERLHARVLDGGVCAIQLRVRGVMCLQSECMVERCEWLAETGEPASYQLVVISTGNVTYTPPSN